MTSDRPAAYLASLLHELCALPRETEWVEFKVNEAEPQAIGEYTSALTSAAALMGLGGCSPGGSRMIPILDGYLIQRGNGWGSYRPHPRRYRHMGRVGVLDGYLMRRVIRRHPWDRIGRDANHLRESELLDGRLMARRGIP